MTESKRGESQMIEFITAHGVKRAIEVNEAMRAYGWVHYWNRAYECWATFRKATDEEMQQALSRKKQ